ncbi:hypothetical protein [Kribbella kalugense]|uniref:Uncharacterized protein n=1 Tax=Kribbella kalugense TaxID=2512221 RepID=A0A4R7ZUW4_9ACTN|nr:hypothetical protein [Kribbella kalugense]TDW21495.1 hypothetical protein EV650_0320 [Kribbella kalugense]
MGWGNGKGKAQEKAEKQEVKQQRKDTDTVQKIKQGQPISGREAARFARRGSGQSR